MKNNILFIAIILVLIHSCNDKKEDVFAKEIKIMHKMHTPDLNIGFAENPQIIDSMLFTSTDRVREGCCKLYSLSNYQEIASFGSIGRGPNEFYCPTSMIGNEKENQVSVYDLNGNKIVTYLINRTNFNVSVTPVCSKQINGGSRDMYPYYTMAKYNDSITVGVCNKDYGEMLGLLDRNLNVVTYFGDTPINEGFSPRFRFHGFVQVKKDRLVYVPVDYQYIACYTINNMEPQKLWEDNYIKNEYTLDQGAISFSPNATGRLSGMSLGEKYIYLYVNDNKKSDINPFSGKSIYSDKIYIYDYEGKHIAKLCMDMRILNGCVSEDERTLYGIAYNPEPALVSFELPASY